MKKLLLVLTVLVLSAFIGQVLAARFNDVDTDNWAYSYIDALSNEGVINGYGDGTFKPDGIITKAEFIKLVVASCTDPSVDITKAEGILENWAKDYVQIAENYEIIERKDITDKNINEPMTRIEMARLITGADQKMMFNKGIFDSNPFFSDVRKFIKR